MYCDYNCKTLKMSYDLNLELSKNNTKSVSLNLFIQ